jgi:hypothetical protein
MVPLNGYPMKMYTKSLAAPRSPSLAGLLAGLLATVCLVISGCGNQGEIAQYRIDRQPPPSMASTIEAAPPQAPTDLLLGAIIEQTEKERSWFFKCVGSIEGLKEIESPFRTWIESVGFSADGNPTWVLPADWKQLPGTEMRFATIELPATGGEPASISVMALPKNKSFDGTVADNVNRWRRQMSLPPSTEPFAGAQSLPQQSNPTALVAIRGQFDSSSAPMASGAMGNRPAADPNSTANPNSPPMLAGPAIDSNAEPSSIPYTLQPAADWRPGRMNSMRMAAYAAGAEDAAVDISLAQAMGEMRDNVARWIGQVHSSPAATMVDDVMAKKETIVVMGKEAERFRIEGEKGQAIDVIALPIPGEGSLFIKMIGPSTTVAQQQQAFEAFAKSIAPR